MIFKKKFLLLTLFLIIIFQTLLYSNNNQKTSFRFFQWSTEEVSIGKLISISFFSGILISTILKTTLSSYKEINLESTEENNEKLNNEEEMISNIEMPPQRDIRDTQPTISVNYRVIKNTEEINSKRDQKYPNSSKEKDDWDNDNNDW